MRFLIDGNNLLHQIPDLGRAFRSGDREAAVRVLLQRLARWIQAGGHKATVVFDGGDGRRYRESQRLEVVESPFADRTIHGLLSRGPWTVVSSDSEVRQAARQSGWDVLWSRELALELEPLEQVEEKPLAPQSPRELADWRAFFGDDLDELEGWEI